MELSSGCAFPSQSWLSWWISGEPPQPREVEWVGECHQFVLVTRGSWTNRWTQHGRDTDFKSAPGDIDYYPADGETNMVYAVPQTPYDVFFLCVPSRHLAKLASADEVDANVVYRTMLTINDACMRRSLSALAAAPVPGESSDEHARALAIRVVELMGGGTPSWHRDSSVFTPPVMSDLVDYIDAHLRYPIALSELGIKTGLSPSHCAKKFRCSTGMSLNRFVNVRRTRMAIDRLQAGSEDLASMALELGFFSQSHMNRVFYAQLGRAPGRYRRQFMRTIG
jgi:AraC-like DNA-binding protein